MSVPSHRAAASSGPVALVTGASRGLGAAIAAGLAAAGHPVAVNYARSREGAEQVARDIEAAGGRARPFGADATSEQGVADLVAEVERELGPVGVLVLNATGPQPTVAARELALSDVEPMLDYFVRSPMLLTRAVTEGMIAAGGGRIVHIGSDVVQRAPVGNSAYVAAKSAQLGLARVAAQELGPHGITVNTVSPGWVPVERHAGVEESTLASYVETVPVGRFGVPADIAAAVVWLSSDAAGFVNGATITVNGGASVG